MQGEGRSFQPGHDLFSLLLHHLFNVCPTILKPELQRLDRFLQISIHIWCPIQTSLKPRWLFSDIFRHIWEISSEKTLHSPIHGIIIAAPSSPSIFMDFWSWWFPGCAQILAFFEHWKAMYFFFAASKLQAIPSGLQSDDDSLGSCFWDFQMTSNHYKSQIKGMTRHGTDPDGKTRHLHWGHVMTTTPWW